jgi:hypothetical protein
LLTGAFGGGGNEYNDKSNDEDDFASPPVSDSEEEDEGFAGSSIDGSALPDRNGVGAVAGGGDAAGGKLAARAASQQYRWQVLRDSVLVHLIPLVDELKAQAGPLREVR